MIQSVQELIADDEGCRRFPYQDSVGIWTVGIGHNLEANPLPASVADLLAIRTGGIPTGAPCAYPDSLTLIGAAHGLTDDEIGALFAHDLAAVTGFLDDYPWFVQSNDARQAALRDMAFNLGEPRFHEFDTFLLLCSRGNWVGAAADLQTTEVYRRLTRRYSKLCEMLVTGQWPSA